MQTKTQATNTINRSDMLSLLIIILYAVYAYFNMGQIVDMLNGSVMAQYSMSFHIFIIVVPLIVFVYVLVSIAKGKWTDSKVGLSYDKRSASSISLAVLVLLYYIISKRNDFTELDLFHCIPFVLNMIASTLVLRALLFEFLLKAFNKTGPIYIIIAAIITGVLFILIHPSFYPFSIWVVLHSIVLSSIYSNSRSILFLIVWDSFVILAELETSVVDDIYNPITAIIIYFILAISANLICRSQNKQQLAKNGST